MAGGRGSEIWDTVPSMAGKASSGRRWHREPDGRELEGVTAEQAVDFLEPGVGAAVPASRTSAVSRLRSQRAAWCEWIRVREAGDGAARRWEEEGGAEREGTARRAPAREAGERRGRCNSEKIKIEKENKIRWGPRLEGRIAGLQKWRLEVEIWRGLKNRGPFEGPAGVVFLHQTFKI
jgi:hypothetical protein